MKRGKESPWAGPSHRTASLSTRNTSACQTPQQDSRALGQQVTGKYKEKLEKSALWTFGASRPHLQSQGEEQTLRCAADGRSSPKEEEMLWYYGDGRNWEAAARGACKEENAYIKIYFSQGSGSLVQNINSINRPPESHIMLRWSGKLESLPTKAASALFFLPPKKLFLSWGQTNRRCSLCWREKQLQLAFREYILKFNSHKYLLQLTGLIRLYPFCFQTIK